MKSRSVNNYDYLKKRKYFFEKKNTSGLLQSLGSLSCDRPQSKSLSIDFKRIENKKIMEENLSLVKRIVDK